MSEDEITALTPNISGIIKRGLPKYLPEKANVICSSQFKSAWRFFLKVVETALEQAQTEFYPPLNTRTLEEELAVIEEACKKEEADITGPIYYTMLVDSSVETYVRAFCCTTLKSEYYE